jgi:hypothetical protein
VCDGFIASGREIDKRKIEPNYLGSAVPSYLGRSVGGTGIHHDEFVGKSADRIEAALKISLFVPDNHAETEHVVRLK